MPKLIPKIVVVDLLDDGPVVKLVLDYKRGKRGSGCHHCIGRNRLNCSSIIKAAAERELPSCTGRDKSYYVLRPLKKSEIV